MKLGALNGQVTRPNGAYAFGFSVVSPSDCLSGEVYPSTPVVQSGSGRLDLVSGAREVSGVLGGWAEAWPELVPVVGGPNGWASIRRLRFDLVCPLQLPETVLLIDLLFQGVFLCT